MTWTSPIGKNQHRLYFAAYGGGNVSGGGPYDSAGNLQSLAGVVEYRALPLGGDLKITLTPRDFVAEMHNGEPTGEGVHGDVSPRSVSTTIGVRQFPGSPVGAGDASLLDFLLGLHPTAVSSDSATATSNDPTGRPFRYWVKQEIWTPDGAGRLSFLVLGHCRTTDATASQGDTTTLSWSADMLSPPWVDAAKKNGIIYAGT